MPYAELHCLSCFSFLPGQWLLRSETLAAMFQFGPAEAGAFLALLLPLAGALAAVPSTLRAAETEKAAAFCGADRLKAP